MSPSGVRDEDTFPVVSSLLFLVSLSSHPNSYSFPQTKSLSMTADYASTRVLRGLGNFRLLSVRLGPSVLRGPDSSYRSLPHLYTKAQKISSAFGTLVFCSSSSRCTASAKSRSPSRRLSRVRMFTVLLLCSFWPTTAERGEVCESQGKFIQRISPFAMQKCERPKSLGRAELRHGSGKGYI